MAKLETTIFKQDIKYFKNFGTINLEANTVLSKLYIVCIFIPAFLQMLSCVTDTYMVLGEIDKMVDNMAIALTYVYAIFKFGVIFSIKKKIVELIESFESIKRHTQVLYNAKEYKMSVMGKISAKFDMYGKYYVRFVFFVAMTWYIQPLIQMKYILPFLGTRYPYDVQKLPWYLFTYMLQVTTNFYVLLYVAAIDLFVIKIISITCEHFDILKHSLSFINEEMDDKTHIDENQVYRRLVKCVKYHQAIIRIANILKECLSSVLMSQFTYNLTTLCFAIMALAKKEVIDGSALNLISYLCLANVEIFVFCWFSDQLSQYSASVKEGAYNSDWISCGSKVRNALRFVMFRSSEPVNLMASGIFPVSVVSYVTIVRTSFSYYTILKQLKED